MVIEAKEIELHTTSAGDLDLPSLGRVLAACGYFRDATKVSQAITKVLAGREIGIGPIAALRNIHIVEGKVELSATLIASLIRRHDRYDYRLLEMSDEAVEIEMFRDGETCGRSRFTITDAQHAGLVRPKSAWEKYPRNMLFARAMSNAARWFAPDVFQGEVYAEGELEIHDAEVVEVEPVQAPEPLIDASDESKETETPDERAKSMRRLHAEASRRSVTHEELSSWAARSFGVSSMSELGAEQIDAILEELQAGRIAPAPGWPHTPAAEGGDDRARPTQWTIVFKRASDCGLHGLKVRELFAERYGFNYADATREQAQAFAEWLRAWLERKSSSS